MTSYRFGPYRLQGDHTLWIGDQLVPLSPMQRRMIVCFCRHPMQVVSKRTLMEAVWGHHHVSEVSLARTVHGLRRRLAEAGDPDGGPGCDLIRNVYSEGYLLAQRVEETTARHAMLVGATAV